MSVKVITRTREVSPTKYVLEEVLRFDTDEAERYAGRRKLRGLERLSAGTDAGIVAQILWHTADGRWVLEEHVPGPTPERPLYWVLRPEQAQEWLQRNGYEEES